MRRRAWFAMAMVCAACGTSPVAGTDGGSSDAGVPDAGLPDSGAPLDAGVLDAGVLDAGTLDAGPLDAGLPDSGPLDAGAPDAGPVDAGSPDSGSFDDAGALDAGPPDSGPGDAGIPDAGPQDAGPADSGPTDAGPPDAGPLDAGSQVDPCHPAGPLGAYTQVRIGEGNLSSGNYQNYDPGEGIRIFRGLNLDIATIQEFNYQSNSDSDIRSMVDQAFGTCYAYTRGSVGAQQIPNGIVSRFPIIASGEWTDPRVSNRDFTWAQIQLPGGQPMLVISVHLLTTSATNRDLEAQAIIAQLDALEADAGFDGGLLVLGGDFNTDNRSESCLTTLASAFASAGPWPVDQLGNDNTSENRRRPHDYLIVDPTLDANQIPLVIGANQFDAGLVFDSRVYTPLADVQPVEPDDSAASGMQHMPVIREFAIANPLGNGLDAGSPDAGADDAGLGDAGP